MNVSMNIGMNFAPNFGEIVHLGVMSIWNFALRTSFNRIHIGIVCGVFSIHKTITSSTFHDIFGSGCQELFLFFHSCFPMSAK